MPKRTSPKRPVSDLDRVTKKWKEWLKDEYDWQQDLVTRVNKLWRDAGHPGPPTDLPPPPKPPFK